MSDHASRKLSLNPATVPTILETSVNIVMQPTVSGPANIVTDLSQESLPDHDEGLAALMRSRSGQGHLKDKSILDATDGSWSRIKLGMISNKKLLITRA